MNENYIGSDFDDFLSEEGMLEEAEAMAVKRVLAYQIKELMEGKNLSKSEMARRMKTSRAALERLLDPENSSVTLITINKAARTLGKRLHLTLQ
jgi:predicted XRE-type DNA-binding protein